MKTIELTTLDQLEPWAQPWNELSGGIPFRRYQWLAGWWRHYGGGRDLCVVGVVDASGSLAGLAPWLIEDRGVRGRVIQFLGTGEVCSDYLSVLTAPGKEDEVTDTLAEWLTGQSHRWDLLQLSGVDAQDRAVAQLAEHLWARGNTIYRQAGPNCWRIELPQTWDEYLASLSKSHRKQVRRLQRRVIESGRAVLRTAERPEDLQRGMEILIDLHQRRRRSLGERGCFHDGFFSSFLHDIAGQWMTSGELRIHWLELDGRPVAAELHLEGDRVTYAYQAGVDPEMLDEEPGRLINIATIMRAIDHKQRAFDFLRGDEPYKVHWRATPRASVELRIVPQRTTSRVRHGVWMAGDKMKNWIKQGLQLTGMRSR